MTTTAPGQLQDLTPEECWELLTTTTLGRIAWTTASGPEVVPVNFVTEGSTVRIRTAAYSALAQKVDAERVAFEVDAIDEATHSGWSVLVRGLAEIEYDADGGPTPEPWASGSRHTTVEIVVDQITGRRLVPRP
jgi:nitroimidazol reductase NimA-like FMN-containing flavoprotein (pyridoxamine 5'-phosphate oxidase superfamily)